MAPTDDTSVIVNPTPDITPEQARDARACAWRFVFDCYEKKKGAPESAPDDAEESKNDRTDSASIHR